MRDPHDWMSLLAAHPLSTIWIVCFILIEVAILLRGIF